MRGGAEATSGKRLRPSESLHTHRSQLAVALNGIK
jgi:hypothetical protein